MPAVLNPTGEILRTPESCVEAAEMRVTMLDLLSVIPYYTGHLCAALRCFPNVRVSLASVTYQHDPQFFRREGIRNDPGVLDLTSNLRGTPPPLRRALKLFEYLLNLAALTVRFVRSRPEILHVQFLPLLRYVPVEHWFIKLARTLGTKVVYTVHNVLPQDNGDRFRRTYQTTYHLADRLICHDAQAAARLVSEFGVARDRVSIIPHGPLFAHAAHRLPANPRLRLGFSSDEVLILWQGILRPYKGISFLLQSWQQVCLRNSTARLVIVGTGDGPSLQAVKDEVRALGLESRVRLELRFVPVDELVTYYHAADVLVYPYREITTSGALMTGITFGKAMVATGLPAFQGLLRDGVNALLVRYGNIDGLTETLLRLIGDEALRARLAQRQSEIELPSWTDIAQQTCECYRAALAQA